eukprot:gene8773-15564_t
MQAEPPPPPPPAAEPAESLFPLRRALVDAAAAADAGLAGGRWLCHPLPRSGGGAAAVDLPAAA